jgi:Integrase core domain
MTRHASRASAAVMWGTCKNTSSGPGDAEFAAQWLNVFVERLWKSVKYEEVYLHAYQSVAEARNSIGRYLNFYNGRRPHSSLDDMTPDQAYFNLPPLRAAA